MGLALRGRDLVLGGLRIGTEPVEAQRAVLDVEHQQDDPPYERDEPDEDPPTGTIDVVEPPDRHGDARDQNRQAEDAAQQTRPRLAVVGAEKAVDKSGPRNGRRPRSACTVTG
jgi:hypothetical protein